MSDRHETARILFQATAGQSYGLMERRFEAANTRIQNLLTFAATLLLGIALPTISVAATRDVSVELTWLALVSIGLFSATFALGLVGRWRGKITLVDPGKYNEEWLTLAPSWSWEHLLREAGEHFDNNERVIECKGKIADFMSAGVALAAVFGVAWAGAVFSGSLG